MTPPIPEQVYIPYRDARGRQRAKDRTRLRYGFYPVQVVRVTNGWWVFATHDAYLRWKQRHGECNANQTA